MAGHSPRETTVRVPGRVNLIGDHTDYTGGLVLPVIVDLHTTIAGSHTGDGVWRLDSRSLGTAEIHLDGLRAATSGIPDTGIIDMTPSWARYPAGVLAELLDLDFDVPGFAGTITSTLPIGGGLSSSASLEVATALIALAGRAMDDVDLARMCQRAERRATGVPCGIMDQLSIVAGRQGYATLIDCSTQEVTYVAIPDDVLVEHRFIRARTLVGSEYSQRVGQCASAEEIVGPLRLASLDDVDRIESDVIRRRARHVVSENARVRAFARALSDGRLDEAGRLMTESHRSLAADFETSTPAMDEAVDVALREPGVLGARMTGGGFGGCIVVLRRR